MDNSLDYSRFFWQGTKVRLRPMRLEEGRQRRVTFFNGEYYDAILYGMLREEFDAQEKLR